jgi:hypothetical protein
MGGDGRRWRHPGGELRLIENKIVIVKKMTQEPDGGLP